MFYLYNHTATFKKDLWPRAICTNGHVLLNGKKMSKSTGNFMTLRQAMEMYSADGVRFVLADAGDTVEDSNFAMKTANDAVLKLWSLSEFVRKGIGSLDEMRTGPVSDFVDRVLVSN